jgi:hypothetical protein
MFKFKVLREFLPRYTDATRRVSRPNYEREKPPVGTLNFGGSRTPNRVMRRAAWTERHENSCPEGRIPLPAGTGVITRIVREPESLHERSGFADRLQSLGDKTCRLD